MRSNPDGTPVHVLGTDIREKSVGRFLCDDFALLPPPESADYLEALVNLAESGHIDVVLPQTSREVRLLSHSRGWLAERGVVVVVMDGSRVARTDSKWELILECRKLGFPVPAAFLTRTKAELYDAVERIGYPEKPVVVRPPESNGMRGLRILSSGAWDLARFFAEKPTGIEQALDEFTQMIGRGESWPDLLVTEFLPGQEYSVDAFRGMAGTRAVVRLRKTIRSGITFDADVLPESELAGLSCSLARAMDLRFAFGFQWKEDAAGLPTMLECNPRVQGTMVAATLAGVNVIWLAIREALGNPISSRDLQALQVNPLEFQRYWGGGAIVDGEFVEI